ncbi:hypothetical protein L6452_36263 [Arctium lappa]|uniref:Uncharacterized protein n=1 Tax=Arctium lappa TaxID=4217 RepID=A0ACB8Y972_ARCLA|nr:hypothetical protein L6452_36263 [Arctium lappa]
MRNAKRKKDPPAGKLDPTLCPPPFHRKWRDELIDLSDPRSGLMRLEPATSALTGRCSDRLNYNPSVVTDTLPNLSILGLVVSERAALPTARIHPFPMRAISPLLSFEYWPSRITVRFESLIARAFNFIRTASPLLSSSPLSISFRYLSDEVLWWLL